MPRHRPLACGLSLLLGLLWAGATHAAPGAGSAPRHTSKYPIVKGLDGQVDLVLDTGRPIRELLEPGRRLSPVEKVRLVARRVAGDRKLSDLERAKILTGLVQNWMNRDPSLTYEPQSVAADGRRGGARLSSYLRQGIGICREQSFLLATLLGEVGVKARVRYGSLVDPKGNNGGHAWVEAKLGGRWQVLDPALGTPIRLARKVPVRVTFPSGRVGSVRGVEANGWLYVPTRDLKYRRPR